MTSLLILGVALGIGTFLVIHGTIFRTRWGINTAMQVQCPRCGHVRGGARIPRNFRQAMWGGGTCPECGLEVDKWNRPVAD